MQGCVPQILRWTVRSSATGNLLSVQNTKMAIIFQDKQRTKSSIVLQCIQMHNVRPVNSESPLMWATCDQVTQTGVKTQYVCSGPTCWTLRPLLHLSHWSSLTRWEFVSDGESSAELWCGPNKDNKPGLPENLDLGLFAKESKRGSNLEFFWKSQWGINDWLDYVVYSQRVMCLFDLDAELAQRYRLCFHRKLQPVKKVAQCQIHNYGFTTKILSKLISNSI